MLSLTKTLLLFSLINILICLSTSVTAKQYRTLSVSSDEWCPYVCNNDALPGFLVEVVKEIAHDNKIKINFSFIPLARALNLAQKGKVDILLALTPQHITDYQLQSSQLSFGGLYNDFYVTAEQKWRFKSIKDLEKQLKNGVVLGTINGYQYGEVVDLLLKDNSQHIFSASGYSPLTKQLEMLKMGRLDILLDSRFTVQYLLNQLQEKNIVHAGTQGDFTPLFLGFSPSVSKEVTNIFDQGLVTLRQSGRLNKILAKYGITDWQQQQQQQALIAVNKSSHKVTSKS